VKSPLQIALDSLSPTQRPAADWGEGAALVLAGPGVGKTTVVTTRLARLLDESRNRKFRVLALTFTTKAGDEMRERVEALVPGLIERTVIGTFHAFSAQLLRQHGSHLGIKPDFGVYDQDSDREELLRDALAEASNSGEPVAVDDVRWLKAIDSLRSGLIGPKSATSRFQDPKVGARVSRVYKIYEDALRRRNVIDFNGLILDACRLVKQVPAVAARVQQSYPYWMIDEFQDTWPSQYQFIRYLAGDKFRNILAVADDDQIIYQWAGASYRQIVAFRKNFQPHLFQLVENRRCPPDVVEAANNLVSHNVDRTPGKSRLVSTKPNQRASISVKVFPNDSDEAMGVAADIASGGAAAWGKTAVLARTRALLNPVLAALRGASVKAAIATRRDRFVSPQFAWLQACLDQSLRPGDKQVFVAMVDAANRIADTELDPALLQGEAAGSGRSFLEEWALAGKSLENASIAKLADYATRLIQSRESWRSVLTDALTWLPKTASVEQGVISDTDEDKTAWEAAARAIRSEKGSDLDLAEFLQGMALRPKEPPPDPDAVGLFTIHGAKGLEFENVWVIGLAESVLPSWQSLKPGAKPAELEEERRNCFVAITRTERSLTLTRAEKYRGWQKEPSRFLAEMGLR
jgi:DNA helicase-2/ATP-dependent DNA helicase PcrA